MKKIKISNSVRYGSISLIATAVLVAILIIVNVAVAALPTKYTTFTNDTKGIYEISDTSKNYLKTLKKDVTVYIIAKEGSSTTDYLMIEEFVARYALLSDKITVEKVDPELYPNFVTEYLEKQEVTEYTAEDLNSAYTHIIVEGPKYSKIIPNSAIYSYSVTEEEFNAYYEAYGERVYEYLPYDFNIENQLLSAIDFAILEQIPTMYYLSGHGETTVSSIFTQYAQYSNIVLKELKLANELAIPDDARVIVIYAPTSDYPEDEIKLLKKFADNGGNIVLSSGYVVSENKTALTNLYSFISEYYGLEYYDVKVYEGSTSNIWSTQSVIKPSYTDATDTTLKSVSSLLYFSNCHAIKIADELPEGVKANAIFTTTANGYAKVNAGKNTTDKKTDDDVVGTYVVGATSERTVGGKTSKLWWYSSKDGIVGYTDLDAAYYYLYKQTITANLCIPVYILSFAVDKEAPATVPAVTITTEVITISDTAAGFWSIIIMAIIPGAILVYGIYVRYRRVRR